MQLEILRGELRALLTDRAEPERMQREIERLSKIAADSLNALCAAIDRSLTIHERIDAKRKQIADLQQVAAASAHVDRKNATKIELMRKQRELMKELRITEDQLSALLELAGDL